ncbi:MAG TPA: hypothetical protein VM689_14245 [Aliidongia sp.]|nr:hypothetical protein [Aliidongia sp.]
MLFINAMRHLDPSFGVYELSPRAVGETLHTGMAGMASITKAGIQFSHGAENAHLDQDLGRAAAIC